ncbi:MAG: NUDIX hydrolase [Pseudomonadota bacterium]
MSNRLYPPTPLLGVCTAIWRDDRILLACRAAPPNAGTWAMPGGLVEVGETLEEAARREVLEETALHVDDLVFNRFTEIIIPDDAGRTQRHFVLAMFVALRNVGTAVAGDDAAQVRWFSEAELENVELTRNTLVFVRESAAILKSGTGSA